MCKIELTPHQHTKKRKGICIAPYCTKKHAPNKNLCYAHIKSLYAKTHPYEYAFNNHKQNAKRRGIESTLTMEQFKDFADRTFYMDKRGKHHNGLHIDRIDENHGYHAWNIQPLTNSENVIKSNKYRASRKALAAAPF